MKENRDDARTYRIGCLCRGHCPHSCLSSLGLGNMFSEGEMGFFALFFFFAVLVLLGIAANQGVFGPI